MEPPASLPLPEVSNLLRRQQQLQAMEVFDFEGVDFVRLRLRSGCRRAYLHAAEDGRSVRLDPRRDSHNAVWAVTPRFYADMAIHCVLLRGAYGRYLGAPDATARGPFSSRCRAACKQRDYDRVEVPAIMWRAVATSRQGAFLLQDATERYLRANSKCLLPCCSGLHVSACRGLCTATQWAVERVPRADRPDLPRAPDSLFARYCSPLPRLCASGDPVGARRRQWRLQRRQLALGTVHREAHDPPEEAAGEPASPEDLPAGLHSLRPRRSLWAAEPSGRQPASQPAAAGHRACGAQHSSE